MLKIQDEPTNQHEEIAIKNRSGTKREAKLEQNQCTTTSQKEEC